MNGSGVKLKPPVPPLGEKKRLNIIIPFVYKVQSF